jgi:hypothetical protein
VDPDLIRLPSGGSVEALSNEVDDAVLAGIYRVSGSSPRLSEGAFSFMNPQEALDYLLTSDAALALHQQETDKTHGVLRACQREIRHGVLNGGRLHLQLWWLDSGSTVASDLIWDACTVSIDAPGTESGLWEELTTHGIPVNHTAYISTKIANVRPPGPLFKYHPMRFRAYNPAAKTMAHFADAHAGPLLTEAGLNAAARAAQAASADVESTLIRDRVQVKDPRAALYGTLYLALAYGELHRVGDPIFDLPMGLVERFRQTDVDDIAFADLKLPYPACYVYFGPQPDLAWEPGWPVDGVYIAQPVDSQSLNFTVTCAPPDPPTYARSVGSAEPQYTQSLDDEQVKLTAGLAIDTAVADRMAELRQQIDRRTSAVAGIPGIIDVSNQNAAAELAALPAKHAAWTGALRLVINGLAYLSAYPDDTEEAWPADTPADLLAALRTGKPKERRRARSKLLSLGYSAVKLAGKRFRREPEVPATPGGPREASAPTWVRGHWVRQPYGPAHSLRRLQWRMPHVRHSDGKVAPRGHLYLVDDEPTTAGTGATH